MLFVNGLPVATLELKTDFTQSVADAIEQYKTTAAEGPRHEQGRAAVRLRTRALVHFAVSNDEV